MRRLNLNQWLHSHANTFVLNYYRYYVEGKTKEQEFVEAWEHYFGRSKVSHATPTQDRVEGFDVKIGVSKIDVKGAKKLKRSDEEPTYKYHWVELKNVQGARGWLYKSADQFAFEWRYSWLVVDRTLLLEHVETNLIHEYESELPIYKLYSRRGRKDLITLVPTKCLHELATYNIPKLIIS